MAKQTSDIFIRLGIENLEGIDKLKSAFRELDKTLGVSNTTITTARQRINEYIAGTTRSEQAINGQLAALRGLRSQVDINGRGYQELTSEINQLQGELRGSTDAVDRQREALLRNAGAGRQNAEALQRQITSLERLRQQTRPGSSAFLQLGQDIEKATASLGRFRSEVSQAASTVTQMPGSTFEKIGNQVAILQRRMQTLNFTSAEFLRYQERINLVNLVQSTIVGRQQVRANAALYASTQYTQFVGARAEKTPLPSTPAGYQQRIGEIQAELENITNLERRRELTVELDGLNRRLASTITTVVTAEQRAVDAVRARVNAQRELLSQSGFGAFSADISGRNFKAEEQAQTIAAVNAASAAMEEAYVARFDAARAGIRRNTELEVQQMRLVDEEDEKTHQATMQRMADEAAAGTKWFNERLAMGKVMYRRNLMSQALGFGYQVEGKQVMPDLSPFYQRVVGLGSAGVERQQMFMGKSPTDVYNDTVKSFRMGERTDLLQRDSANVGDALGQGIEQGLVSTTTKTADTFANRWLAAIKARFGIRSPSEVTKQQIGVPLGQGVGLGFIKGLESTKGQIQAALRTFTSVAGIGAAPLLRTPLPRAGQRFSPQAFQQSQVADEVQAFLVRMSAKPTSARRLTRLIGEDIKTSPALSLAMERSMYEKGIGRYKVEPWMQELRAASGEASTAAAILGQRRSVRGFPRLPGYGLEQLLERQATYAAGRTGAFFGPVGTPLRRAGAAFSPVAPAAPAITPMARGAFAPLFAPTAPKAPGYVTPAVLPATYRMGEGLQYAFPSEGPAAIPGTGRSGRAAASRGLSASIQNYRKAIDAVWESDASHFSKLRSVVVADTQVRLGRLARRLTETRTNLDQLGTETSKAAGIPAATFGRLRAQILERRAQRTAVAEGAAGGLGGATFPSEGMIYPSSPLGRITAESSMFAVPPAGGGRPPIPPVGAGGAGPGDLGPKVAGLKSTLLDFGPIAQRSIRDLQELRSVLQEQAASMAPGAAGSAMRREYDTVLKTIEQQDKRLEREVERRNRPRQRLGGRQIAQIGGAAISGGIFGGPEGFLGGVIGGAFGVGGAFAGAAAGAQVGMLRQQLAGTTAYAAEIGKMQIALRGVSGSQANYNQAIQAAARLTNELNIPQREATAGITRLGAAVLGAGGTMNDATYAFRAITESIKATGGNAEQVDGALLALTQVFSKGKVSAEELNQIAERLPGTFTLFAKATGKTGPELQKALEQGTVGLNDLMKFLELASSKNAATSLAMSRSSEDAGARMTIAFQKMALEVGKVLQPIGAQFQDAFANFAKQATPGIIEATKSFGGLLKTIMDNGQAISALALLAVNFGIASYAIKAFTALQGPLTSAMRAIAFAIGDSSMAAKRAAVDFRNFAKTVGTVARSLAPTLVLTVAIVGAEIVIDTLRRIDEAKRGIRRQYTQQSTEAWVKGAGGAAQTKEGWDRIIKQQLIPASNQTKELMNNLMYDIKVNAPIRNKLYRTKEDEQAFLASLRKGDYTYSFFNDALAARLKLLETAQRTERERYNAALRAREAAPTEAQARRQSFPTLTPTGTEGDATRAANDAQRTAESLAQQEMRLADAVFDHRQDLERKRYELSKELLDLETKNRLDQMGSIEREAAQALEQRRSRDVEYQERLRDINDQIAKAQRELLSAQRMAAVTGGAPGSRNYSNIGGLQGGRQMLHGIPGYAGYDPAHATPTNIHYHFSGKSPQETLAVATYLRQQGYQISEFGGMGQRVGGHADGSQHYRNNAFDIGGASLGQTDAQIQAGLKRVHALINVFLNAAPPTAGPAGAQGRRNITDVGDVGIARSELGKLFAIRQAIIEQKPAFDAQYDKEYVNSLTSAFRSQNEELSTTLRTETLRAELQSKGYTSAQITLEMDLAKALELRNRKLSEIPPALSNAPDAIGAVNAAYQEQVDLLNKIYTLNQANANSFGFREGAQRYVESIGTMRDATAQLTESGLKGLEDVLFQLTTTGTANFQEFAASILQQSARMIMQLLIQKTIMQIIGAIGGGGGAETTYGGRSFGSIMAGVNKYSANGNVFAANGIVPYAMGGIVNRPTLFPFANGGSIGTGLMGEAGPEAIIPLQRGANGKLGVAGGGGTTNIVVNVDASGGTSVSGDEAQAKQLGQVVTAAVQAELLKQKRPGGLLNR